MVPLVVAIGHIKLCAALECRISLADLEYQPDFMVEVHCCFINVGDNSHVKQMSLPHLMI